MSDNPADAIVGRFAFGENWREYAGKIDETHIEEATCGLRRLLGGCDLQGVRFLDIGCGSGIHAVAALRLGASHVDALDFDPESVQTAQATLARFCPDGPWAVGRRSVFDLDPSTDGRYDVVYSWGVLHHTGAMKEALKAAAAIVPEGGRFVFALYRRTVLCPAWKLEKKWYAGASAKAQARARRLVIGLKRAAFAVARRDFDHYVATYKARRGMLFEQDMHDWLGGWPYESISPGEVERVMLSLGLLKEREFAKDGYFFGVRWTEFGSGCDEYVYRRGPSVASGQGT